MLTDPNHTKHKNSPSSAAPIEAFRQALQTITKKEVSISGNTVVIENTDVMELALIQRKTQHVVKYHTRWLASDNLLILRGDFIIKAGYDLSQSTEFSIENGLVSGNWPEAKILSVEMIDYEVYHSKNGSINKLQAKDHEAAVKQLLKQARQDAQNSDLLKETQKALNDRLNDLSQDQFLWPPQQLN